MADILYLVHRLPYPPNKGDKVRSYHVLKHLARRHRVHLGTFIDDPRDERYVGDVRALCADLHVERMNPSFARLRSMAGLVSAEPLTLPYYRSQGLADWVGRTVRERGIDTAVVFSSAMGQYVTPFPQLKVLLDFVDVDSEKWTQYAPSHTWPLSWLYRREGRRLLAFEAAMAGRSARSFFVTDAETALFRRLAPQCAGTVETISNGVDAEFFSPDHHLESPYPDGEHPVLFTGAMDYWPNVDAVTWFAAEVAPRLRRERPSLRFYIVGMNPAPAVQALAGDGIVVTGTVPDVRPYLRHAAVVVAPLRVARGVQNKVLEAMAMGRPVVASRACAQGIAGNGGEHLAVAATPEEFARAVDALLCDPASAEAMGVAARARVLARYSWDAHLSRMDDHLEPVVECPHVA